jgi:hypothetical protein
MSGLDPIGVRIRAWRKGLSPSLKGRGESFRI